MAVLEEGGKMMRAGILSSAEGYSLECVEVRVTALRLSW